MFIGRSQALLKRDSFTDIANTIYSKGLNLTKNRLRHGLKLKIDSVTNPDTNSPLPFTVMTWSFAKADSIADFVAAVYSKGLNFAKTDFATDLVSAISS